jgi:hypothetical protein
MLARPARFALSVQHSKQISTRGFRVTESSSPTCLRRGQKFIMSTQFYAGMEQFISVKLKICRSVGWHIERVQPLIAQKDMVLRSLFTTSDLVVELML